MRSLTGYVPRFARDAQRVAAALLVASAFAGCATPIARNGISDPHLARTAVVPGRGLQDVRFWADETPDNPIAEARRRTAHMPRIARDARTVAGRPIVETLALSGGGSDGAFGAGVLAGWTERGDRPEFEIVTGVSAGAIIAPFAYLGPSEDQKLKAIWTEYRADQVVTAQLLPGLLGGDALADTAPLEGLIAKYVDERMLQRVAAEYARGRMLFVLSTNLDAQRPVVWNMGEIARAGTPEALALFRKVIMASAAIPGAFPPVNIPVTAGGKMYEEMHVDGGTTREIFVLPVDAPFKVFDALYPAPPIRKLYLIKNGKLAPEQEVVKQTTLPIAARAISTLIKSQNWSELYRIYRLARDAGADYNLMAVPPDFQMVTDQIYDPKYQLALYETGVKAGRANKWAKTPPNQSQRMTGTKKAPIAPPARTTPDAVSEEIPSAMEPPSLAPPTEAPSPSWQPSVTPAKDRSVASAG